MCDVSYHYVLYILCLFVYFELGALYIILLLCYSNGSEKYNATSAAACVDV